MKHYINLIEHFICTTHLSFWYPMLQPVMNILSRWCFHLSVVYFYVPCVSILPPPFPAFKSSVPQSWNITTSDIFLSMEIGISMCSFIVSQLRVLELLIEWARKFWFVKTGQLKLLSTYVVNKDIWGNIRNVLENGNCICQKASSHEISNTNSNKVYWECLLEQ